VRGRERRQIAQAHLEVKEVRLQASRALRLSAGAKALRRLSALSVAGAPFAFPLRLH